MIDNPCLRAACLSDVVGILRPEYVTVRSTAWHPGHGVAYQFSDLQRLYDAEWAKRGFTRSP
jgi:hypothetical protein